MCCKNKVIRAAQHRSLLSDREATSACFVGIFFFPPCAKPQTNKTGGKQRRLQWVLRQHSRGLRSQEIPVPAGRSTWRPGVSRRGRDILLGNHPELGWALLLSWAPSPALPHPPRTALGASLQVLLAGTIALHQVCPSIHSFPCVPPSPSSTGYWEIKQAGMGSQCQRLGTAV